MKLIKILPNFLTILNGLCGCLAILLIFENDYFGDNFGYQLALFLVILGGVFDYFDGYFAGVLNAKSKIGIHLDSLSDLITFSLAPAFLMYDFFQSQLDNLDFLPLISLLIIPFSMIRLARFNSLPSKSYFLGLPTPANGIFFIGIPFLSIDIKLEYLAIIILCFCFLMISNIKFESFKKSTERRSKKIFYLILTFLLTISFVSIIFNSISLLNMVSITILTYILSSILFTIYRSI